MFCKFCTHKCCLDFEHYMCAKFHFVDLAGSERANRTGNVGKRFKGDTYTVLNYIDIIVILCFAVSYFIQFSSVVLFVVIFLLFKFSTFLGHCQGRVWRYTEGRSYFIIVPNHRVASAVPVSCDDVK